MHTYVSTQILNHTHTLKERERKRKERKKERDYVLFIQVANDAAYIFSPIAGTQSPLLKVNLDISS